jgi:hypothetical protein
MDQQGRSPAQANDDVFPAPLHIEDLSPFQAIGEGRHRRLDAFGEAHFNSIQLQVRQFGPQAADDGLDFR